MREDLYKGFRLRRQNIVPILSLVVAFPVAVYAMVAWETVSQHEYTTGSMVGGLDGGWLVFLPVIGCLWLTCEPFLGARVRLFRNDVRYSPSTDQPTTGRPRGDPIAKGVQAVQGSLDRSLRTAVGAWLGGREFLFMFYFVSFSSFSYFKHKKARKNVSQETEKENGKEGIWA